MCCDKHFDLCPLMVTDEKEQLAEPLHCHGHTNIRQNADIPATVSVQYLYNHLHLPNLHILMAVSQTVLCSCGLWERGEGEKEIEVVVYISSILFLFFARPVKFAIYTVLFKNTNTINNNKRFFSVFSYLAVTKMFMC